MAPTFLFVFTALLIQKNVGQPTLYLYLVANQPIIKRTRFPQAPTDSESDFFEPTAKEAQQR